MSYGEGRWRLKPNQTNTRSKAENAHPYSNVKAPADEVGELVPPAGAGHRRRGYYPKHFRARAQTCEQDASQDSTLLSTLRDRSVIILDGAPGFSNAEGVGMHGSHGGPGWYGSSGGISG